MLWERVVNLANSRLLVMVVNVHLCSDISHYDVQKDSGIKLKVIMGGIYYIRVRLQSYDVMSHGHCQFPLIVVYCRQESRKGNEDIPPGTEADP